MSGSGAPVEQHDGVPVALRPPGPDDVALLDRWREDPRARGEYNDFGDPPPGSYREVVASGSVIDESGGLMLVVADGEPVGTVTWRSVAYGPNAASQGWNVGISLVPDARGQGVGVVAQRLLADHLLATTPVNRVEAITDVTNTAEQHSLERAGFTREGVLRGAQFRAGVYHDMVCYARLRSDQ